MSERQTPANKVVRQEPSAQRADHAGRAAVRKSWLVDTHCHVHFPDYKLDSAQVINDAVKAGVSKMIAVGCTLIDSELAIEFAKKYDALSASIGLHPHEAKDFVQDEKLLQRFRSLASKPGVVAIGEAGLDYYYKHSEPTEQKELLRYQLTLAQEHNLPMIFHVRDAFDDFWPIYDKFKIPGVVHSFSAGQKELDSILKRGLFVGLNGIMTFTKNQEQLEAARSVPLKNLLLETDAPFLTPVPYRGKICQPKYVLVTAEFLSNLRSESLEELAAATTQNAARLFKL